MRRSIIVVQIMNLHQIHILAVGVLSGCEIILMEVAQDAGEIDTQGASKGLGDCEWPRC